MLKYGLPGVALVVLVLAVISIARTQPVRTVVPPPAAPAISPYPNQVGGVGHCGSGVREHRRQFAGSWAGY